MLTKKYNTKPFPKIAPLEPSATEGRTVMFMNTEGHGLTALDKLPNTLGKLVLFASDAEQELEIYAPTSFAS